MGKTVKRITVKVDSLTGTNPLLRPHRAVTSLLVDTCQGDMPVLRVRVGDGEHDVIGAGSMSADEHTRRGAAHLAIAAMLEGYQVELDAWRERKAAEEAEEAERIREEAREAEVRVEARRIVDEVEAAAGRPATSDTLIIAELLARSGWRKGVA